MIWTTNIAPPYLCTTNIAQHSASFVQRLSDLRSKLCLACNERLNIFAFVNDMIRHYMSNTSGALYVSFRMERAKLQSRKVQNDWYKGLSAMNVIGYIRFSGDHLLNQEIAICRYVLLIETIMNLSGPIHWLWKKGLLVNHLIFVR